ncbi:bifunctional D-glycero-beta-D-manno-heptose-7-phosphate kinase/D-glycero-beta-D-manno-heptose 1-phosphate adenylyltransferase HldE [Geobacter sp. DSM 9736]|uniref:bifunctional D-glycero-beta-D-manno-heptose-7-phosphate kinase/D-glycero-beta-D-manno-heptose 1-phosphate adenylyltransferase HldE n=1 Tax=Geobacter sp. DSM 9736 TaxID=1277350 RepID=UPI000B500245|nr:bifunctional D-glycero-beta-D-manno-heptose-7-phosphate kinase/D-glycero-beta-D-manno-heptose 1-phosphate adenylyltransferase HldE [Geobacter sp. DSM 9736]SNB45034.1 D-alpha,beta-D-heptose 7-phosphate 1-kinase /D-beta-D-heptose 1-phosphate adenylyltransferase [Geobacter sp. DSM 9736]
MQRKDAESLFAKARNVRALVIGDLMLDEYLWGKAERISPEAPVQVVDIIREDLRLGGAGNVVNNLAALGCSVSICSVIGADENGTTLQHVFTGKGVDVAGVFEDPLRTTSKKTRVVAANQQIVRMDRETKEPLRPELEAQVIEYVERHADEFQVLLLSDYLKGVLTERVVQAAVEAGRKRGIPVVIDPKGSDYSKYRGATILTPNRKEAEQAAGMPIANEDDLGRAAERILRECELDALLITRSEQGMSLFGSGGWLTHIPTFAREVYDVTGAGDTVLAVMGVALACGIGYEDAARVANVAAGIAVGKVGTSTVTPSEVIGLIGHGHADSDAKIKNLDVLVEVIEKEKGRGKQVVFTNGCFDLLHVGHVKYLQKARSFGDLLVLGLNSDASVRRLKGDKRPLIPQEERAHLLAALNCVDYVVFFDDDTPLALIETLKPMVLVKGGDYTPDTVVGRDVVESCGGRVELVEFVDGKSTTNIIEKILTSYGEGQ